MGEYDGDGDLEREFVIDLRVLIVGFAGDCDSFNLLRDFDFFGEYDGDWQSMKVADGPML